MAITYHARRIQGTSTDVAVVNRGTITTDGSYTVIKFTENGTFTPTSSFNVEYLVVAGGGGSGAGYPTFSGRGGGGGGAGGYLTASGHAVTAQSYAVTVGDGGTANNNGQDSVFDGITAYGGGRGAQVAANSAWNAGTVGSGGGDSGDNLAGTATVGQGNDGGAGSGTSTNRGGGGGGGSGSVGISGTYTAGGSGGAGTANSITGTSITYAAGGDGGNSDSSGAGTAGAANTGNGASGGSGDNGAAGAAGGSGIVILRFLTSGNGYNSGSGFPENVQVGSRFEETDTRKMYNYVVPSITFQDNFSSDNWTDSDSTNIGVSGGALNWSMFRDMSNDASSRDLGSVASDKWVLRFKVTQGSSIGSTQAGNGFHFGISDSDNSVAQNASQDFVGMSYYYDNQSSYRAQDSDGAAVPEVWGGDSSQNFTITANDVFYFEIIKNGSSYTVEGFTNSDYSTGSLGQISGTTTATGLRYLKIMNDLPAQGAVPTSTNPFNGTIDDVKFYDGFTQTTSFWQEIGA